MQRNTSSLIVNPTSSYKRYIDSRQASTLINKKLIVETQVIDKLCSSGFNSIRHISHRKSQSKNLRAQNNQRKAVQVESLGTIESVRLSLGNLFPTYNSPKTSRITIRSSTTSPSQGLANRNRSQSAICRLGLLKQRRKGDIPDKLFSSLSVFFGQAQANVKKSTREVEVATNKLKIQGFTPVLNYSIQKTL